VFYITITIAFREYELFGQTLAFALLIATTVFSVLLLLGVILLLVSFLQQKIRTLVKDDEKLIDN
jgi:hypothetical protein